MAGPASDVRARGHLAAVDTAKHDPDSDTHGEWLPLEPVPPDFAVPGCDEQGLILNEVETDGPDGLYKATENQGVVRFEIRFPRDVSGDGGFDVEVTRVSDGATVVLPNDGPGYEIYSPDGASITFGYAGPGLFFAFDENESRVFAERGLPDVFWWAKGWLVEKIVLDENGISTEGTEIETDTMRHVYNLCDLLDDPDLVRQATGKA